MRSRDVLGCGFAVRLVWWGRVANYTGRSGGFVACSCCCSPTCRCCGHRGIQQGGACPKGHHLLVKWFSCNVELFLAPATPTLIPSKRSSVNHLLHIRNSLFFLYTTVKMQDINLLFIIFCIFIIFHKGLHFGDTERDVLLEAILHFKKHEPLMVSLVASR